ncbi:hypothetical protein ACP4OV_021918 [Aristida adscensionis]
MDQGSDWGGKKAKVYVVGAGGQVKQEMDVEDTTGDGAGAMVLAAAAAEGGGDDSRMPFCLWFSDKAVLHCPLCSLPLKPPIFQRRRAPGMQRLPWPWPARRRQVLQVRPPRLLRPQPRVGARRPLAMVKCPNDGYGCRAYIPFCADDGHRRECPCAPCRCPERGCPFVGSPAMLLDHVGAEHQPIVAIRYGTEWKLHLTPAQRWLPLVGQEDRTLFLVSQDALGAGAGDTAVSPVCVRADGGGAASPQYTCRLALELPPRGAGAGAGDDDDDGGGVVVMEWKVHSSGRPAGRRRRTGGCSWACLRRRWPATAARSPSACASTSCRLPPRRRHPCQRHHEAGAAHLHPLGNDIDDLHQRLRTFVKYPWRSNLLDVN